MNLVALFRERAREQPDRRAYLFLQDGEAEGAALTYAELDIRARALGAVLAERGLAGERALLLYPPGLDFVTAFLGCLYGGVVAVPAYPPRSRRTLPRLRAIAVDSRPQVALTHSSLGSQLAALGKDLAELGSIPLLVTDEVDPRAAEGWREPKATNATLAFLQYTSGSTAAPKGVMVCHGNLLHNEEMIRQAFGQTPESVTVGWLPLYHDMGLIGNVLQPLYTGGTCILMSPVAFLQRPRRWLAAISRYRATTSGGPNFAYELCVAKIGEAERAGLDLTSWEVAFNGAEPVRAETLDRFVRAFAPHGFRQAAFYPCYGLAEATLFVAGGEPGRGPEARSFAAVALEQGRGEPAAAGEPERLLVGCGRTWLDQEVAVVDPGAGRECEPGGVGEIWVSGPSVTAGYWGNPEATERDFGARLGDRGPYLRTGDLGLLLDGLLFVTGRSKDLIILRGRNLYPQDVELTAERSHPGLRPGCGAAFAVEMDGAERLVVVHEVDRHRRELSGVAEALRAAVAEEHEAQVQEVVLVREGTIPKTSSGKIQRGACRQRYLAGSLAVVGRSALTLEGDGPEVAESAGEEMGGDGDVGRDDLLRRLRDLAAAALRVSPSQVDPEQPLSALGLDSMAAIELKNGIETELETALSMAWLLEGPSLVEVARQVRERTSRAAAGSDPFPAAAVVPGVRFPLSHGQRALWFLDRFSPGGTAYVLAGAARLHGRLEAATLERSLTALVARHPALRTGFGAEGGEPFQWVREATAFAFAEVDATTWGEEELPARLGEAAYRPFDLERDPLLRVLLFHRSEQEHLVVLAVHHIVADFWSLEVLLAELGAIYRGDGAALPPLSATYSGHVSGELARLASPAGDRLWDFWRRELAGQPTVLDLPADRPRPRERTGRGGAWGFRLPGDTLGRLRALGRAESATLFMTLLAAFQALLQSATGQEEMLVGSPTAGRAAADLAGVVGYFVNPVVLRGELSGEPSVRELLGRVRRRVLAAFTHQAYPFPLVAERLQPNRDPGRSPLFQVMLTLHGGRQGEEDLASLAVGATGTPLGLLAGSGLAAESLALPAPAAQFDLALELAETGGGLAGRFVYDADLFDRTTVARLAGQLAALLEGLEPAARVWDLPLLAGAERWQLLAEWNDTAVTGSGEATVAELLAGQAARTPAAPALSARGVTLTYAELDLRVGELARHLGRLGVGPEVLVGICARRSIEMVVGLLAVLKAGGAYVPLDPSYPRDRLAYMLADSQVSVLLTEEASAAALPEHAARVVHLDRPWPGTLPAVAPTAAPRRLLPDNLAYVIYTSGSTGRPKGVGVRHRGVVNFFAGMDAAVGCGPGDRLLAVTSINFDISVLELLWTLARGAQVVLLDEQAVSGGIGGAELARRPVRPMQFSLFYFASEGGEAVPAGGRYRLLMEGAKFADENGFTAVWTPERHFHAFGGLYPNPSVTSAAIAALTRRVEIRAGSVVLPLHDPLRVAEEWAVVDNLSHGRVGIAFASGWHSDDFAFRPESYADRKEVMLRGIETVQRLWRGEAIRVRGGAGNEVEVRVLPRPIQAELPVWITAAGAADTFAKAGEIGANVLTHLLGQTVEEVATKIRVYREARAAHGHDPEAGCVTLMLHTLVGSDRETVRRQVRGPFTDYLRSSLGLVANLVRSLDLRVDLERMSDEDRESLLAFAFDRYFETSALFGDVPGCLARVEQLSAIGVDEVACLIDFGVDADSVLQGLDHLARLRAASVPQSLAEVAEGDFSLPAEAVRYGATLFQCTPSTMRMLAAGSAGWEPLRSLRALLLGGEALPSALADEVRQSLPARLVNMYGPTETTVWSATQEVGGEARGPVVPIGRPIANTHIHLLDAHLRLLPVGVPGALYIGGDGLARGYLRRPDLTAERFVPDPASASSGARRYHTGDLARWRPDGALEFLGRVDQQVKVRGFRIELGEIESVLSAHPAVAAAAVVARMGDAGEVQLIAYAVAARPGSGSGPADRSDPQALRSHLAERLPEAMVPLAVVLLDELPLTPNGKVDRRALAARGPLQEAAAVADGDAPRTPVEEVLAALFAQLLEVEQVGRHDGFFALGGHSLLATQLLSRIRDAFEVDLPLRTLFEAPTLALLAPRVETALAGERRMPALPIQRVARDRPLPLSFAQDRLWFLDQLEPGSATYNDSVALSLAGRLRPAVLRAALAEVVRRHEALRTTFTNVDGRPAQVVTAALAVELPLTDLTGLPVELRREQAVGLAADEAARPFDLARGPLFRARLLRLADGSAGEHVAVFLLHHTVSDGWSLGLLVQELAALYTAFVQDRPSPLPDLPVQYADFASWQREWLTGAVLDRQLAYWRERLAEASAALDLPADRPRPAVLRNRGGRHYLTLSADLIAALRRLARREGVTLFMAVLAGLDALLYRLSGQRDLLVGSPISGRYREDLEPLIGLFVNTLVLRVELAGETGFGELARRVRESVLEAYAHQDLPFERLVEGIDAERNLSYTPLFQVAYTLQDTGIRSLEMPGLVPALWEVENGTAKFDLTLQLASQGQGVAGWLEYNRDLFDATTAARMLGQLLILLEHAAGHPEERLGVLPLFGATERHQILAEWNDTDLAGELADGSIHGLFERQAARTPEAVAVIFGGVRLTYRQVNERASRLARLLRSLGTGPGEVVAIWMHRCLDLVPALLGILKAGATYVPMETGWPQERCQVILSGLRATCLLTESSQLQAVQDLQWKLADLCHVVCLDVATARPAAEPVDAEEVSGLWDHLAERATDRVSAGGFVSIYTGRPFTEAEVDEYVERVVGLARPYAGPGRRVLEIGCGSGLLAFALAGGTARYVGLDPSAVTQARNRRLATARGLSQLELVTGFAHELDGFAEGSFDLVLLASTAQFFPGPLYLERMIESALRLLAPGGALLLADVLDDRRKAELRRSLEEFQARHQGDPEVRTKTQLGSELYVDEDLFRDLAAELPGISGVRVLHRESGFDNELRYRYDVIFERAAAGAPAALDRTRKKHLWTGWWLDRLPAGDLPAVDFDGFAYIIFTSGSTGVPKGVAVRHRPVLNLIDWVNRTHGVGPDDRVLFVTSLCFDLSVYDVFGLLAAGGAIHVAADSEVRDPQALVRLLTTEPITFWDSAPAALQQLVPFFPAPAESPGQHRLRRVFLSGDWIPVALPDQLRQSFPAARVIALGGATEATVWSNSFPIAVVEPLWKSIPYGRPIQYARYHVFDGRLEPCPVGVPGDLYIGGLCLATGYTDPVQTADRFIPDPVSGEAGSRLYRTGDRARYFADGNLEFLGRSDQQVKIRGFRIEQGEIESVLAAHPRLREAVVTVREDTPGDRRLVAYVVPHAAPAAAIPAAPELRAYLREKLPEYMIPAVFVTLPALPVTANGKLDRQALPAPRADRSELAGGATYAAPRSTAERTVVHVWREVLGVQQVGIDDNFFDLGGHSLLMAEVHRKLKERIATPLSMLDLFRHPTVASLAEFLALDEPEGERSSAAQQAGVTRAAGRARSRGQGGSEVAIVGMAGRFPGAASPAELWRNLCAGVESLSLLTDEELLASGVDPHLLASPHYVRLRGLLEGADRFDAPFFGFSPRESEIMDPQHRIFLECAWEALEDAGYDPAAYGGAIGLFAGAGLSGYIVDLYSRPDLIAAVGDFQAVIGNDKDFLPTRVSYELNLKGPSVAVQTACSTSLVAVHLACQSLLQGECDMALAGGVSVRVPFKAGYLYQESGILSPDGHCRAFDAAARGTAVGSGAGLVVLKRLENALADGDSIYAVIRGSAINNDGSAKVGYTAPSVDGQAAVIAEAQAVAGVEPDTIGYIEAHGTGTRMGDPIEIAALTQAFRARTERRGFCAIGSVKTNLGHLDTAAGVTGLIKAALALRRRQIPPSLHFATPNPEIDFASSPVYVNTVLRDWESAGVPRRAGVSSFGIGGTNAHMVLEEAPEPAPREPARASRPQLLLLSARTETALETGTARLAAALAENSNLDLTDVAYTLAVGRRRFEHRRILVCQNGEEALAELSGAIKERIHTGFDPARDRAVAFLFPGQGAQHVGMGGELYRSEPVFRQHVDQCAELLAPELGLDLRSVLYPEPEREEEAAERLQKADLVQPALFVVESALARLWMEWGVRPRAMIGHSLGEYVAAYLAGVFSLADALALVTARARLIHGLPGGAMLAVSLPEEEIEPLLTADLSLAAVNGPALSVVSGPAPRIAAFERGLAGRGVGFRRLPVSHAFHSAMMDPAMAPLAERVREIRLQPPRIPYISNLTGRWIEPDQATDPAYWAEHLRRPVRLYEGLRTLCEDSGIALLEVGPGKSLSSLARRHLAGAQNPMLASLPPASAAVRSDLQVILTSLGRLWMAGVEVDWQGFYGPARPRRVALPTYPFERQRYLIEPRRSPAQEAAAEPGRRPEPGEWLYQTAWRRTPPPRRFAGASGPWLLFVDGHGVGERLAARLERLGVRTSTVTPGERFSTDGRGSYSITPSSGRDYEAVLADLAATGAFPSVIAHLWSLDESAPPAGRTHGRSQELGFASLLLLAQSLGRIGEEAPLRLGVVTAGLHSITGAEEICPEGATVLGPAAVLPRELPHVECLAIDIVLADAMAERGEERVDLLLAELAAGSPDPVVGYRHGYRWVRSCEAVRREPEPGSRAQLRPGGTYLLSGWLDGIGAALAEYLVAGLGARLLLAGGPATPVDLGQATRRLEKLKAMGAPGSVLKVDDATPERLAMTLQDACERFGRIDGVLYLSFSQAASPIQSQVAEHSAATLLRWAGTVAALHAEIAGVQPDFVVLCSGLLAAAGGPGQVNNAAAAAFLDTLAQKHRSGGGPALVSIAWDESPGEEIAPGEAGECLARALELALPQVVVSPYDPSTVVARSLARSVEASAAPAPGDDVQRRRAVATPYVSPGNPIEQQIADLWEELLGIERVGLYDDFYELGGHSLTATQLVSRLRDLFDVTVPVEQFLAAPTIASLAEKVMQNQAERLDGNTLAQMLSEIQQLSPEELKILLKAE